MPRKRLMVSYHISLSAKTGDESCKRPRTFAKNMFIEKGHMVIVGRLGRFHLVWPLCRKNVLCKGKEGVLCTTKSEGAIQKIIQEQGESPEGVLGW